MKLPFDNLLVWQIYEVLDLRIIDGVLAYLYGTLEHVIYVKLRKGL